MTVFYSHQGMGESVVEEADGIIVHVARHDSELGNPFEEVHTVEEARIIVWKRGTIYSWTRRPNVNANVFCWFLFVALLLLIVISAVVLILK